MARFPGRFHTVFDVAEGAELAFRDERGPSGNSSGPPDPAKKRTGRNQTPAQLTAIHDEKDNKMIEWRIPALAAAALLLGGCGNSGEDVADTQDAADTEDDAVTIESLTENSDRLDGMFTFFVDRDDGTIRMLIDADRLGKEYVYVATVQDAPPVTGQFRGNMGVWAKNGVMSVDRHFGKVQFVEQNVAFWFDPENPLSRAADANISPAVTAVADILAEDEDTGAVLIDAGPVFLSESFVQLKPSPNPNGNGAPKFDLGSLSDAKTRFTDWRAYPENVDLFVEYVYENPAPAVPGGEDVTDSRFVSIKLQHSFVEMPDNDFAPRSYDPRVGYYLVRVTDQTSTTAAPWLDYINRWHLKKKNPDAEVSDPVEPIVYWIENTTPLEYRDTVRDATLAWNEAFEQAGISNAIEVRVQPDDAEWDAGDIRYNVIRWTSSPNPPFGGYGPVILNPRTSQIIGSDIMLELVYMTNRVRYDRMFSPDTTTSTPADPRICDLPRHLQEGIQLGRAALRASGESFDADAELVRQGLFSLVLHEVGHTLGLNHNFMGSQMLTPDELYSRETTESLGTTTGSVMDYAPVNVSPRGREQGLYYEVGTGPYDRWVIEYGYSQALADPAAEKARLDALLARSTERPLWFANDGDDMRGVGAGIDPRVMIDDYSSDAIAYATDRMGLIREVMGELVDKYAENGASYQELVSAYQSLVSQYDGQAKVISRYVGGVYVDRAVQGQPGAGDPYRPVALADQRRAMERLSTDVFAADALTASDRLYRRLQTQRRDFDFYGTTEDPKIHDQALGIQKSALNHLLHPVVMKRLTDSALYGNEYAVSQMMSDLTAAMFDADMGGDVNSFRQNLQSEYVTRLVAVIAPDNGGGYDQPSRAIALFTLQDLKRRLGAKRAGDLATRAHTAAVLHAIDKALETT